MPEKYKLRKTERLVLGKLEQDSRLPFSRYKGAIKKSQQLISYTVKSLIKKEIIQGFYTLIDYSKLDLLKFRVFFKVSYINKRKFDSLIGFLILEPHTSKVITCGGRYDLICTFMAKNPSQFNKTLHSVITKFPDQLQNYTILTTIVNREFGRKYLMPNVRMASQLIFGGDRGPEVLDETDKKILCELSTNARKNTVDIAKKVILTPKSVISRIKNLQKKEIILGFKPILFLKKMGYISNLLLIKYHNLSIKEEDSLIMFLKSHKNVTNVAKVIGEWDLEINIETPNHIEFREIEIEIRQRFSSLIQEIESIPVYRLYKLNYFPSFLIKNNKLFKDAGL